MGCVSSTEEVSSKYKASADDKGTYSRIDAHAKASPSKLRSSVIELVSYMQQCTKDHKLLVRGFFVWISENIMYDIDGLRGYRQRSGVDTQSVMKSGLSVCEGYANVMKDLCEEAGIPVKKISGFSKGAGYDPSVPFSETSRTDHAWNAVQLDGKWHLLDSTWGTGHDNGREYVKEFDEFYFLTKPEEFVNDHFPYIDGNMKESLKWQLLKNPKTLDEFNKSVQRKSHAFTLGIVPVSHQKGHIVMKDEAEIRFKSVKGHKLQLSGKLLHKDGNMLREQRNATFCTTANGVYSVRVHPTVTGKHSLKLFAKIADDEGMMPQIIDYSVECTFVREKNFEFPQKYGSTLADQCSILKPLNGQLPSNSEVVFEVKAPNLEGMSVNKERLEKRGTTFYGIIKTGDEGFKYDLSSAVTNGNRTSFEGLFGYRTV